MRLDRYSIDDVRQALKASAELDKKICDEEWLRCYQYHENWSAGVDMAKYDNGEGDHLIALFSDEGAIIKGFDHESKVSPYAQNEFTVWPGMYQGAPVELLDQLNDIALEKEHVTFCYWRSASDDVWKQGSVRFENNEDDGSDWLLKEILMTYEEYIEWAKDYYEEDFNKVSKKLIINTYMRQTL